VVVLLGQVPATLGLDVGAVRFVALRASQGDAEGARASLQAALGIVVLVSGALAALLYWQAPWLSESFFHKPAATDLVRLAVLALPALALTRVVIGGLQGLGVMRYSAFVNPFAFESAIRIDIRIPQKCRPRTRYRGTVGCDRRGRAMPVTAPASIAYQMRRWRTARW